MELFKANSKIDFMGIRKITRGLSLLLCLVSVFFINYKGLNFGLDFTGGNQIEMRFTNPIETDYVKKTLVEKGYPDVKVQHYGSSQSVLIRIPSLDYTGENKISDNMLKIFKEAGYDVRIELEEFIGSEVGEQLTEKGIIAVIVAVMVTMIYIAIRFEYRFAISSAVALVHDILLILGFFAFFQVEFDLSTLAAVLAILGYSLNDTIVVFDRVRENFRKMRKGTVVEIMNASINQTLSRTIVTSWLTLLVVIALLVYGTESLFGFSLAMFLGIVIGTYSSIFVAGALAVSMGLSKADLMPPQPKLEEV